VFYLLIEGVCIHPTALREDADEMKAAIDEFKETGQAPPMVASEETGAGDEDPYCTRYKKRLEKYLRDGVMGINTATGKLEKMTGEAAERAIEKYQRKCRDFLQQLTLSGGHSLKGRD